MTVQTLDVKKPKRQTSAPLMNMMLLDNLVMDAMQRPEHLPGICGFSGHSGFGKSTAAAYVAAKHQAEYIEVRSLWTKRSFLEHLVKLLGREPRKTAAELLEQVVEGLARSGRPLLIDEFDNAIDRGLVEIVRDIHEQTKVPVIIIGEEKLPLKIKRWERFDGRILSWVQAKPADVSDVVTLNNHYEPGVRIQEDFCIKLAQVSKGSVRRIVTNIEQIARFARTEGLKEIGLQEWGSRPLYTGTNDIKMREV